MINALRKLLTLAAGFTRWLAPLRLHKCVLGAVWFAFHTSQYIDSYRTTPAFDQWAASLCFFGVTVFTAFRILVSTNAENRYNVGMAILGPVSLFWVILTPYGFNMVSILLLIFTLLFLTPDASKDSWISPLRLSARSIFLLFPRS